MWNLIFESWYKASWKEIGHKRVIHISISVKYHLRNVVEKKLELCQHLTSHFLCVSHIWCFLKSALSYDTITMRDHSTMGPLCDQCLDRCIVLDNNQTKATTEALCCQSAVTYQTGDSPLLILARLNMIYINCTL